MKDGVRCFVAGPMVAAFDAQIEAEDSGILFTPEQWSSARESLSALPSPRARGSVPPPFVPERTTKEMPAETLESLVRRSAFKRSLAHTCPSRRK